MSALVPPGSTPSAMEGFIVDRDKFEFLFGHLDLSQGDLEGLDPDDTDDRGILIAAAFPIDPEIDGAILHQAINEITSGQIASDRSPIVWETVLRLQGLGLGRDEIMGQLAQVTSVITSEAISNQQPYDAVRHEVLLNALPLPTVAGLRAVLTDLVINNQGISADDLDAAAMQLLGVSSSELIDELLDGVVEDLVEPNGELAWLAGDHTVHVRGLTDGIVLTHRLSAGERLSGVLDAGFDLGGFWRRGDLRLPDGQAVEEWADSDEWTLEGPDGWLLPYTAGGMLAVRIDADDTLRIVEIAEDDAPLPEDLLVRLRAAYVRELGEAEMPVDTEELILSLLLEDRSTFESPRPPMVELCYLASLERRGAVVAHAPEIWSNERSIRRGQFLHDGLGDDDMRLAAAGAMDVFEDDRATVAELRQALTTVAVAEMLDALADAYFPMDIDDQSEWLDDGTTVLRRLAAAAHTDHQHAFVDYLLCVAEERFGSVVDAAEHLERAMRRGSTLGPIVERVGWYASDRGDARGAIKAWSLLGEKHPAYATVEPFAADPHQAHQRNAPCWCGSGRKYKQCHLRISEAAPLPDRVGWLCRKATSWLEHATMAVRSDIVACALARAVDSNDDASIQQAFADPLLFDVVLTEAGWFEQFLEARGDLLPDDERLLAESWLLIDRTVHEVVSVSPGSGLVFRNLSTGEVAEVRERSFSRQAEVGSMWCCRVVPDGQTNQIIGGLFPVGPGRERAVLDLCDEGDPVALCRWRRALDLPPTMSTREGEPLVECIATLSGVPVKKLRSALNRRYEAEGDGVWLDLHEISSDESILRAKLELVGDVLTVTTHSEPRMDRVLIALVDDCPGIVIRSDDRRPLKPGEMPTPSGPLAGLGLGGPEIDDDVREQIIGSMHERWLSEPVPALGGLTPRQAAADPVARETLERLIRSFPPAETFGSAGFGLDPDRLREALDL